MTSLSHPGALRASVLPFLALFALPLPALAQQSYAAAAELPPVLEALDRMRPVADSSIAVRNVTLTRGTGTFTLVEGRVWPLTPVNGRIIGAVFKGTGRFAFSAPDPVEQQRLRTYFDKDALDEEIVAVSMYFTDGTWEELRGNAPVAAADVPSGLGDHATRARLYLRFWRDRTWEPGFLEPVLNGRTNGGFHALIDRARGEELWLGIDPDAVEPITLGVRDRLGASEVGPEDAVRLAMPGAPELPRDALRRQVAGTRYVMDVRMPQATDGGVSFSATAEITLSIPEGGYGPWIPLSLYRELEVDSASWDGQRIDAQKPNDTYYAWVRAPGPVAAGSTPRLTITYHGDLMERYGDWFVLKSSTGWYPQAVEGRAKASFDITYHTPLGHPIGSVGQRTDSSTSGRLVTTRWVHEAPIRNASFNIGRFEQVHATVEGSPPITLLWSEVGHRALTAMMQVPSIRNVRGVITQEAGAAMKFFTQVYGPPIEPSFYATEIPLAHGEAFPGLVHLSYITFAVTDRVGYNTSFRAHEVAHQWWGIGVDYASYRDRWLSEGLSEFSGLWYLQTRENSTANYLAMLREYRGNLLPLRGILAPTSLGHRAGNGREPKYYGYAVYQKGAWTMHMLRTMMLQLSTMNEDRFTNGMREFYTTYRGRSASTDDFRVIMEKHAGADLRWFFDQWIDGTAIPTYRWAWRADAGAGGQHRVRIRVRQTEVPANFQMYVPVTVELRDGRMLRTRVHVVGPLTEVELPPLPAEVKTVRFNDFEGVLAEVSNEGW